MRVTNKLNAYNAISTTQSGMSNFYKIQNQLSSGNKIQHSFEGATTYIDNARLEYEYETLQQIQDGTSLASEMTKNSDKALGDMVDLLEQFKRKLTQAVNDTQSQTSREAIAKELQRMRDNIVDLANTSVNGQYLFSGAQTGTKPFNGLGNYFGDREYMHVVTGAGTQSSYNVPGYHLFFKADSDFKKVISTNVNLTDNRYDLLNEPDKTRYLKETDKISSLIGLGYVRDNTKAPLDPQTDFEISPLNFPSTTLYVQGTRPDGTSFKSAVLMNPNDTMQGMIDKIGALYGNTDTNKVVDITINDSGQFQITDLKQGNNSLDFHAVAFTPQFEDSATLKRASEDYIAAGGTMQDFTNEIMDLALANPSNGDITNLNTPVTIAINGVDYEISINQNNFIHSKMTDTLGNATNGADYDNTYFLTQDNKTYGNVSQIVKATGEYATESTRLSEVATGDLNATTLNLKVTSKGRNEYDVTIDFANSTISYPDPANPANTISFPFMSANPATPNTGVITPTNDISYRQLNDIIGLFASDSQPTTSITANPAGTSQITAADYETYTNALQRAKSLVDVSLDYEGRITLTDKLSTGASIQISLSDTQSGQFPMPPHTTTANVTTGSALSFNANNSLIIDEPHVDMIKDLDLMIEAVLAGDKRANADGKDPRNTGMQGALARIDHLSEHIIKQRTQLGASASNIEETNKRAMLIQVNVKSIKSEVMDIDLAATITEMMQVQTSYQAALKASTMLSQLSLLNYM
ncbi:flagellin biosynthesis protein FlgL [Campylobacter sp. MIT 99-7217]|uniref:flagellar hook-associated protein FlgL n=1 Tax=Campylobacter sp. MIT 99-7217 TaxID=535091 RepID=UPI001159EC82|nr:flagellar hook-associated protein FlgL [Campylobacter sp. MIT 99-7217]TQR33083.1 flagellin biosynthesis protein FlgL [Campylobacter sp. MIT 99-7217]